MNPLGIRFAFGAAILLSLACANSEAQTEAGPKLAIPLEIEVNGRPLGSITVEADRAMQDVAIDGPALLVILASLESSEVDELREKLATGFVALSDLNAAGLGIELDLERLVIVAEVSERKSALDASTQRIRLGYRKGASRNETHASEARISGYANFNIRATRFENEIGVSHNQFAAGIDHTLNIHGFAIEGDSSWSSLESNAESRFRINRLRVVKDFPNRMRRVAFGDLSTPIKEPQRGFQIWGFGIQKEFDLQPYRTFTPTSSASFQLEENAIVQLRMNGRPLQSLSLEPGQYDIEQFKLAAGLNTLELEIATETGTVERVVANSFAAPALLGKGVSTYAFTIGYPHSSSNKDSKELFETSWYRRSILNTPIASGYYQLGLSDSLTGNINLQASPEWTRLGVQSTWASSTGAFNATLGANAPSFENSPSLKTRIDWQTEIRGYRFVVGGYRADKGFERISSSQGHSSREAKGSLYVRVSKRFGSRMSADVGFLRQSFRGASTENSIALNLGYRFSSFHSALSLKRSNTRSFGDFSAAISVTWNPADRWRARTRYSYSNSSSSNGVYSNFDYSKRSRRGSTYANFDIHQGEESQELEGRFRHETEGYSLNALHTNLYRTIGDYESKGSATTLSAEFAIAFADGSWGSTRKIGDSFAIVANHPAWKDIPLGINPTLDGFQLKTRNGLLKPTLSDLPSYRESQATIRPIKGNAFLEQEEFSFFPSYKRGSKLTIGNEYIYSLRSALVYCNLLPVRYKALTITGDDIDPIRTFTNAAGKFVATGLKPGDYSVGVSGSNEGATFSISGERKLQHIEQIIATEP